MSRAFDRRRLLFSFLGAAAAVRSGSLAALGGAFQDDASARPLGLQLYTLRAQLADDFEGTLARVAELGFEEVETFSLLDHSATQVRAMLDRHGLRTPSGHTLLQPLRDDLTGLLEDCEALGQSTLVLAYLLPNQRQSLDQYRELADELSAISERCRGAGVQLGYHNHDFEFVPLEGEAPYDILFERTSPEDLVMELDLYWIAKAGGDPLATLGRDPDRFPMVHVKDMEDGSERGFTEVGTGVIDFAAILADPRARGIRHLYVEQDEIEGDPWQSVTTSRDGLREALSG